MKRASTLDFAVSSQAVLLMVAVVLTALVAGFGATYAEQHARVLADNGVRTVTVAASPS